MDEPVFCVLSAGSGMVASMYGVWSRFTMVLALCLHSFAHLMSRVSLRGAEETSADVLEI